MNVGLAAGLAAASTESGQLHAVLRTNEGLAARAANAEAAASRLPGLTASNAALTLRVDNLQKAHDRLQARGEAASLCAVPCLHGDTSAPSDCHELHSHRSKTCVAQAQQLRLLLEAFKAPNFEQRSG